MRKLLLAAAMLARPVLAFPADDPGWLTVERVDLPAIAEADPKHLPLQLLVDGVDYGANLLFSTRNGRMIFVRTLPEDPPKTVGSSDDPPPPPPPPPEKIEHRVLSAESIYRASADRWIIRDQADLEEYRSGDWNYPNFRMPVPAVDFEREMVVTFGAQISPSFVETRADRDPDGAGPVRS